jgi:hypothetical protein
MKLAMTKVMTSFNNLNPTHLHHLGQTTQKSDDPAFNLTQDHGRWYDSIMP